MAFWAMLAVGSSGCARKSKRFGRRGEGEAHPEWVAVLIWWRYVVPDVDRGERSPGPWRPDDSQRYHLSTCRWRESRARRRQRRRQDQPAQNPGRPNPTRWWNRHRPGANRLPTPGPERRLSTRADDPRLLSRSPWVARSDSSVGQLRASHGEIAPGQPRATQTPRKLWRRSA